MDEIPHPSPQIPGDIKSSYEAYGCKVNAISPEELFDFYAQAGFLYPAKMEKLSPFLPIVKENWRKGLRGGELILYCVTKEPRSANEWATITAWRTTNQGWHSQHLVSLGNPMCSRAVMLAPQAMRLHDWRDGSYQNWFRPENRFPAKVFGTLTETIGDGHSVVRTLNLLALPKSVSMSNGKSALISAERRNGKTSGLYELAERARGRVFAIAEELGEEDVLLDALDQLYDRVGLRRYRRIWLASKPGDDLPLGAALVYRGPLGFNFSFLENRCDLILSPNLPESELPDVALPLLAAAVTAYEDFTPGAIPLVADDRVVPFLERLGARFIRQYCQSIWLRNGFLGWYRHVEKFYERIVRAHNRRGLGHRSMRAVPSFDDSLRALPG